MSYEDWDHDDVDSSHIKEWVEGSGVDVEIAKLNLSSLEGDDALEALTADRLGQLGGHAQQYATAPVARLLERYQHVTDGGWWCGTALSDWGCFKPNNPRTNDEGKPIKYEHPLGVECGVFWLRMPDTNYWEKVLANPATFTIVITEGAKKAAALLTAGIPAVALSGIWNGTPKVDPKGDKDSPRCLHPDLEDLIGHRIVIAFDYSSNNKGKAAVRTAAHRLAQHLYGKGCPWVGSATCTGPVHKGVDDVLVHEGADVLRKQIAAAVAIENKNGTPTSDWELTVEAINEIKNPVERNRQVWSVLRQLAADEVLAGTPVIEQQSIIKSLGKTFSLQLDGRAVDHVLTSVVRETTTKVEPVMGGSNLTVVAKRWILQDLMLHGFNLLNGMPGAGKTRFLMALVLAWINGHSSFVGHNLYAPPNSRVLILGLDQDLQEWADVMAPLGLMTTISSDEDVTEHRLHPSVDLYPLGCGVTLDRDGLQLVSRWTANNAGGLIIGDSVSALLPVGVSESDDSLGRWARDLDEARRSTPLILTHHITKEAAFTGNTGVYAGRGSGSLDAACSRVLGLSYLFHKENGKDVLHKTSPRRQLVSEKRGTSNKDLIVEMGPSGSWDFISTTQEQRQLEQEDATGQTEQERFKGWKKDVWEATTDNWLTTSQIANRLNPQRAKAANVKQQTREQLRKLADEAFIEQETLRQFQGDARWRRSQAEPI